MDLLPGSELNVSCGVVALDHWFSKFTSNKHRYISCINLGFGVLGERAAGPKQSVSF
jgi:hypothetical protein